MTSADAEVKSLLRRDIAEKARQIARLRRQLAAIEPGLARDVRYFKARFGENPLPDGQPRPGPSSESGSTAASSEPGLAPDLDDLLAANREVSKSESETFPKSGSKLGAIIEILREAPGPLRYEEIHRRMQERFAGFSWKAPAEAVRSMAAQSRGLIVKVGVGEWTVRRADK